MALHFSIMPLRFFNNCPIFKDLLLCREHRQLFESSLSCCVFINIQGSRGVLPCFLLMGLLLRNLPAASKVQLSSYPTRSGARKTPAASPVACSTRGYADSLWRSAVLPTGLHPLASTTSITWLSLLSSGNWAWRLQNRDGDRTSTRAARTGFRRSTACTFRPQTNWRVQS